MAGVPERQQGRTCTASLVCGGLHIKLMLETFIIATVLDPLIFVHRETISCYFLLDKEQAKSPKLQHVQ